MPFLTLPHADIYYTDIGDGDPVLLVHGRSASSACWDWHISRLRATYRVIAFDSVNHGFSSNSPRGQAEPDRYAELNGVIDALGLERPTLVGQSLGAITVLRWATRNPDRARVIVAAGMGWPMPNADAPERAPLREGLWIEAMRFDSRWAAEHPIEVDRYSRLRSTASAIEAVRHPRPGGVSFSEFFEPTFGERLRCIQTPVHLFMGEQDYFAETVDSLAAHLSHAQVTMVPGADHSAYIQEVDALVDLIHDAVRLSKP